HLILLSCVITSIGIPFIAINRYKNIEKICKVCPEGQDRRNCSGFNVFFSLFEEIDENLLKIVEI
ncbi:MAG: hypothetical protein ACXAC7_18670, partial [Candidatus Hodarchaeales archaeon]